jgi:hypothetical protein
MSNSIIEFVSGTYDITSRIQNKVIRPTKKNKIYTYLENLSDSKNSFYLDLKTKINSGYIIMNSGRTKLTARSPGKIIVEEIVSYISTATVLKESLKTLKDSFVFIWGSSKWCR